MRKIIIRRDINRLLAKLGYEVRRIGPSLQETPNYVAYRFLREDGSFDYEKYRKVQIERNKRKIANVWAIEENIAFLSRYIESIVGTPQFGICHCTRCGMEQAWFKKYLNCNVIGTEISDTANQFPDTIQWDFHEVKPEWIDAADFIYSNSFDHSYDPEKCINAWMSCVKKGGLCILEHSSGHGSQTVTQLDPFGADIAYMPYLILTWAKGKFGIREIIEAPAKNDNVKYLFFIVVQKW